MEARCSALFFQPGIVKSDVIDYKVSVEMEYILMKREYCSWNE